MMCPMTLLGNHDDAVDTGTVNQEEIVIVAEDRRVLGMNSGVKGHTGLDQEVEKEGPDQEVEKEDSDQGVEKEDVDH